MSFPCVACRHHPAYSKGSHNSDQESQSVQLRQRAVPLLEAAGMDLLLNGHSHGYERTRLLHNHHGASGTYSANTHVAHDGYGRPNAPYRKPAGLTRNNGFVAVTMGTSGVVRSHKFGLKHPAMVPLGSRGKHGLEMMASMVLDITDNRLELRLIGLTGNVLDTFAIVKS